MGGTWKGLDAVPERASPSAVTIGNFDGVHLGHRAILRATATTAGRRSLASVALTFDPHPLAVVAPGLAPAALTSVPERASLIRQLGIDWVAVLPFTEELSLLSPGEFAAMILAGRLGARHVRVGPDFGFGRGRTGTADTLRSLGARLGFDVAVSEPVIVRGEPVSSTRVRSMVRAGGVEEVRELLGRDFCLRGAIVKGDGIGSRKTVPTLNLSPESEVLPGDGVYVTETRARCWRDVRRSVTNVGMRPTFGGRRRTVETYLLGSVAGAPPDTIELRFLRKIRDERRFPSAEKLRDQIQDDIAVAERYFGSPPGSSVGSLPNS